MYLNRHVCLSKDSQEFLLFLLNELHNELKQVTCSDAVVQPSASSEAERSLSDTEHEACNSARGSDAMSDDSNSSSLDDDVLGVCGLVFFYCTCILFVVVLPQCESTEVVSLYDGGNI